MTQYYLTKYPWLLERIRLRGSAYFRDPETDLVMQMVLTDNIVRTTLMR